MFSQSSSCIVCGTIVTGLEITVLNFNESLVQLAFERGVLWGVSERENGL